jgi:hypothetical protein
MVISNSQLIEYKNLTQPLAADSQKRHGPSIMQMPAGKFGLEGASFSRKWRNGVGPQ